jgi:hypothetical protein
MKQQEAAYWLDRYLAVIQRIFEREEQLTASNRTDTLQSTGTQSSS